MNVCEMNAVMRNMANNLNAMKITKGSGKMVDNGITISMERFAELIRKEVAYDMKVRDIEEDLKECNFVSDFDKRLFVRNPFEEQKG